MKFKYFQLKNIKYWSIDVLMLKERFCFELFLLARKYGFYEDAEFFFNNSMKYQKMITDKIIEIDEKLKAKENKENI